MFFFLFRSFWRRFYWGKTLETVQKYAYIAVTLKCQPDKMVKHTQMIRRLLLTNCLSVFDRFVGFAFKVGLALLVRSSLNSQELVWKWILLLTFFWVLFEDSLQVLLFLFSEFKQIN